MFRVSGLFLQPLSQWALHEGLSWPLGPLPTSSDSYTQTEVEAVWQQLLQQHEDTLLGYHAGRFLQPAAWLTLTVPLLHCSNFQRGYELLLSAQNLLVQPEFLHLEERPDQIELTIEWPGFSPLVSRHLTDYSLCCLVVLACWLRKSNQWIDAIKLPYPKPNTGANAQNYRFFRYALGEQGRLQFDAASAAILISRDVYESSLRTAADFEPAIPPVTAGAGTLSKLDWLPRARLAIERRLGSGDLSRQRVAADLCVSERTLQRALESCSTSYAELVQAARLRQARRLLEETDSSVLDIALEIGFRDPANFFRLFKRIVGMTPAQYREHQRQLPLSERLL